MGAIVPLFFALGNNFLQPASRFVLICLKLLKTWHFALILTAQHLFVASRINRFSLRFPSQI